MINIRYFRGRHKIEVLEVHRNKAMIKHLEHGYTGNKKIGYKKIKPGDIDIVPTRLCWKNKLIKH